MHFEAGAATDRGRRAQNQDAHFLDVELGLLVVADGMGGHRAGEVASQLAVSAVVEFIKATQDGRDITWPAPFDPERSVAMNRVDAALRVANQKVLDAAAEEPQHHGMGTTIVAALVTGASITIGHVGDSRAYVLRSGQLRQITEDHTLVNALGMGDAGEIDHPMRHVLTHGIGMGPDLMPAVCEQMLMAGDRWLICTDGIHGYLDGEAIRLTLSDVPAASDAAAEAVRRALHAGTLDNATALVLNVSSTARV